jgi:hypothetical protein
MFSKCSNTKKQGDVGLGAAIAFFSQQGCTVLLPLTDSQGYDLVIDDGKLRKIQVKTTNYKLEDKYWNFNLSVKGGNQSGNTIKKFDNSSVDFVFVLCGDGTRYLIPSVAINAQGNLTLYSPWNKYKI